MKIDTLTIHVGPNLDTEGLKEALYEHSDELESFLAGDLSRHDPNATCDEFQIIEVQIGENFIYQLDYHYTWSAYYGCKDANRYDEIDDFIHFSYEDGVVRIDKEIFEPRYPCDEF